MELKRIIFILAIFLLGGLSFFGLSQWLNNEPVTERTDPALEARLEAQRLVDESREDNNEPPLNIEPTDIEVKTNVPDTPGIFDSEIVVEGPFKVIGTDNYPASGQVEIIRSPEETLISYKNYQGTGGSDLYIYLAKDLSATDHISLGPVQGSAGDHIYGAPLDIDFTEYSYILTWSESLGELYDYVHID